MSRDCFFHVHQVYSNNEWHLFDVKWLKKNRNILISDTMESGNDRHF